MRKRKTRIKDYRKKNGERNVTILLHSGSFDVRLGHTRWRWRCTRVLVNEVDVQFRH